MKLTVLDVTLGLLIEYCDQYAATVKMHEREVTLRGNPAAPVTEAVNFIIEDLKEKNIREVVALLINPAVELSESDRGKIIREASALKDRHQTIIVVKQLERIIEALMPQPTSS